MGYRYGKGFDTVNSVRMDQRTIDQASEHLRKLQEELHSRFPKNAAEIVTRVQELVVDPQVSTAADAWNVIWHKPLFTNARIETAKTWKGQLDPVMESAWRTWGKRDSFLITRKENRNGRSNNDFQVTGKNADVLERTSAAVYRLFTIQSAAVAFRKRTKRSKYPMADLCGRPLREIVPDLQTEFGWGWGPTTVLHMLTDLGMAVKTDRHVVRTLRKLGMWKCPREDVSVNEAIALNGAVQVLCKTHYGRVAPRELRQLDLYLLRISKGFDNTPGNCHATTH